LRLGQLQRLAGQRPALGAPAGQPQHPGQVEQGAGPHGQHVGVGGQLDRLGGQPLGLVEPSPPGQHQGQGAAPLDLGVQVVADGHLAADRGHLEGLVVAALAGQRPGQIRRHLGPQAPLTHALKDASAPAKPALGRRRVAGQQLDLAEELGADGREPAGAELLGDLGGGLAQLAGLAELAGHGVEAGQGVQGGHLHPVAALGPAADLLAAADGLGHRGRAPERRLDQRVEVAGLDPRSPATRACSTARWNSSSARPIWQSR
jgi:hypothetical protein